MLQPFRVIAVDEFRDATEYLVSLRVSDEELAERGIRLSEHATVRAGLGPSAYLLVEFEDGLQCGLDRLDHAPEFVDVAVPLIDDPEPLVARVLGALDLPGDRVVWSASDDHWNELRLSYDRGKWLRRTGRPDEQP